MTNLNKNIIWVVVLCWGFLVLAGNAFAADSTDAITLAEVEANYAGVLSAEGAVETSAFRKLQKRKMSAAVELDDQKTEFGVLREGTSIGDGDGAMGDTMEDDSNDRLSGGMGGDQRDGSSGTGFDEDPGNLGGDEGGGEGEPPVGGPPLPQGGGPA